MGSVPGGPERHNPITFRLSFPYSESSKRKDGRERKDEPANDLVHVLST